MTIAAIILAAGRGERAGGDIPKQWQKLRGRPVIAYALDAFATSAWKTVIVLHQDDFAHWEASGLSADIVVSGGATRDASVRAGLAALESDPPDCVLIHDAARPLVSQPVIEGVTDALKTHLAAAPAVAVTDALWHAESDRVTGLQDRSGVYRAQTPQGFDYQTICDAHAALRTSAADDVAVALAAGIDVAVTKGSDDNIKITGPEDFARATHIMGKRMDIRLGNGFDVHRFGDGDHVILCGVTIPHGRGLQGHSDADVGMHAITDAIYGALCNGDIGQHFPPSDPKWKGADSRIFLKHAAHLAKEEGFEISHVDCTLICEQPKIGPHQGAMRAALAGIIGISGDRISVKATTSERLGFTGRGEGIAALATATLVQT